MASPSLHLSGRAADLAVELRLSDALPEDIRLALASQAAQPAQADD